MSPSACLILVLLCCAFLSSGQVPVSEFKAERDPVKRADRALAFADQAFDNARGFYNSGAIQKGDAQLEDMMNALNECVSSLNEAHKSRFYKKPELRVANLQRRLQGLLDDIGAEERGWAEYTQRKLSETHDKLLNGVMSR